MLIYPISIILKKKRCRKKKGAEEKGGFCISGSSSTKAFSFLFPFFRRSCDSEIPKLFRIVAMVFPFSF